jgi:hypothetical protein
LQAIDENNQADACLLDFYNFSGQLDLWEKVSTGRFFVEANPDKRYSELRARNAAESESREEYDRNETAYNTRVKTKLGTNYRTVFNDWEGGLEEVAKGVIKEIATNNFWKRPMRKMIQTTMRELRGIKHVYRQPSVRR